MYLGYILHPQIPVTNGMKIAELGTGTGTGYIFTLLPQFCIYVLTRVHRIWLFDAAIALLTTVELHGYDICESQFPATKFWPENVTFGTLDSLTNPPQELFGQYDVVHLRMWASNLKENDTVPLIEHVKQLLSKSISR
jgi:hypothetical protein